MLRIFLVVLAFCLCSNAAWTQTCTDARSFDFKNATIETAPQDEGSRQGSESFHLRDGVAFISDNPDSLESHDWRVDLLEDRAVHPDPLTWVRVIVLERDHLTGTGTWYYIMAFGCHEGSLVRLFQYSSEGAGLKHLDQRTLELYDAIWKASDAHCCPSVHLELSYRWNAQEHRYRRIATVKPDQPVSDKVKEMLLIQRAKKGDTLAQSEVVRRAEKGDPQAQSALADNYEYGYWVPKDHAEALRWYRKAAEQGDAAARSVFGRMYFDGDGVKRDYVEAARWYGCPRPSEAILASCKETSCEELPQGAVNLLRKMKCDVGSNYDYGSAVDLSGNGTPVYQVCCSEPPHGPCGAVVIGRIGEKWKDLTAKEGLLGFDGACNLFVVLDSEHNGFHDVCLPDQCSTVTPVKGIECVPTIWQFSNGRYRSVANTAAKPQQ